MSSSVQLLEVVGCSLRDAMQKQDWEAVARIDLQCRQAIEDAMVDPVDESLLRARMEDLLGLYRQLIEQCQSEKLRVAEELVKLNQSRQSAKVYQLFG